MQPSGFLLLAAVAASAVKESLQSPEEARLYSDLLKGYNKFGRPVHNDNDTVTVKLGFRLFQIIDVDETKQMLTTNAWLEMYWNDSALKWDKSSYGGVSNLRLPESYLWKPDIMMLNSIGEKLETAMQDIYFESSGECVVITPAVLKSTCAMDLRWFPFDEQRCTLKFMSWTYSGVLLELKLKDPELDDTFFNPEWDVVELQGHWDEKVYDCCPEAYHDITFTIVMRRRALFYSLSLLIPCVVISALALFVFLLPVESTEKTSLGITVLLSLLVFMCLVTQIMPITSASVPLFAVYLGIIMVLVGFSVIATVVVSRFYHHNPRGGPMPKWIRVFLLDWCSRLLHMKRPGEERAHNGVELGAADPKSDFPRSSDPAVSGDKELLPSKHQGEPELANILEEVRYIAKTFHDQHEMETVRNEWRFAAAVIDRLCLVAFLVLNFLCIVLMFASA